VEDSPDGRARVPPLPEETTRAQKLEAIARLAPGITHELNNPLVAIVGFAELLRTDPRLPDDMRRQAELLATETATVQAIVQTLLEFLRARPPERHPTALRALVDAVLLLHGYRLASGQIEVVVDVAPDVPDLAIDRPGLQLVLVNLVQEAVDALLARGGPGRLALRASRDGASVRISVAHDAPVETGARSSGERERAWQVSSAIVADHGGFLERSDDGATMALPVTAAAAAEPAAPSVGSRTPRDGAIRVLILDDERSIGMLLEKWLRTSGYAPTVASSGPEAVDLVRDAPFDAVLCDHRMAGMAGTEVFDAIVAIRPELERRFVFMSGDVLNPDLQGFVQRRGVGLLAKPFDRETVHHTLEAVLRS
jgi:two-component system NtrC family sensor kinase